MIGETLHSRERRRRVVGVFIVYITVALVAPSISVAGGDNVLTWAVIKSAVRTKYRSVDYLSTAELATWMQSDSIPPPILLDARELKEYDVSHIRGAVMARKLSEALMALSGVNEDHPIVVYCSVGYRSGALAEKLQKSGYTNVYNLEGSIFEWANEDRPVFAGKIRVYQVHPYDKKWGTLLDRRFWPDTFGRHD